MYAINNVYCKECGRVYNQADENQNGLSGFGCWNCNPKPGYEEHLYPDYLQPEGLPEARAHANSAATLGSIRTEKKARSSRENGKKGGRPKLIYDTGEMSIDGNRDRVIVSKTANGISVKLDSLYTDMQTGVKYYRDGDYPVFPEFWNLETCRNWYHQLYDLFKPYRTKTL